MTYQSLNNFIREEAADLNSNIEHIEQYSQAEVSSYLK